MTAHYYCMACGLLLPNSARSPASSTRLKCPHCHCEMELPSLPSTPTLPPTTSSPATPGASSSSSIFSYQDAQDGDADQKPPLGLSGAQGLLEQSKSKKDEEGDSDDEGGEGGESERDNSRGRRSKKGKKRDPLAPKRASNAYMLFCKEQRPLLKQRQPDLHFSSIGQILGEMWRTLPLDDKRPYEERAADDRDRYKHQMQHYNTSAFRHSGPLMDDAFSAHSSPSLMPINPSLLPFSFPPSSAASSSSSTSSPFATFPPGAGGRYQPYPMHGGAGMYGGGASPQSTASMMSSASSYASIKRGRLERANMSENEYFARLYHFQKQQQEMINEDIRRYGRQRTYSPGHPLPPLHHSHPTLTDLVQGAGGGVGAPNPPMHVMGGPPSYSREESLSSAAAGEYLHGAAMQHHVLPNFFNNTDMDNGGMDDLEYRSSPQRLPHWDYEQAMH